MDPFPEGACLPFCWLTFMPSMLASFLDRAGHILGRLKCFLFPWVMKSRYCETPAWFLPLFSLSLHELLTRICFEIQSLFHGLLANGFGGGRDGNKPILKVGLPFCNQSASLSPRDLGDSIVWWKDLAVETHIVPNHSWQWSWARCLACVLIFLPQKQCPVRWDSSHNEPLK